MKSASFYRRFFGIVPLLALLASGPLGAAVPVSLTEKSNFSLGKHLEYFRDKTGKLTIHDVLRPESNKRFLKSKSSLNLGATPDACWVRFSLKNDTTHDSTWLLEYGYPPMDSIFLFQPTDNGEYRGKEYGDQKPFHQRDVKHRNFIFTLKLKAGEEKTFYMRFKTEAVLDIPLYIWTERGFQLKDHDEQYALGLYYGIMLVMLLYNLFIFFSVRDRSYLYYAAYIICMAALGMSFNGLAFEYIWPNWIWFNTYSIAFAMAFGLIAVLLFTQSALEVHKENHPRLNMWITVTLILVSAMIVSIFIFPYKYVVRFGMLLAINCMVAAITAGIVRLIEGYHPARFFMIAWTLFALGAIALLLKNFTILPTVFLTTYGLQIGSALEVVLLSFALADRINVIKKEKEEAQASFIDSQKVALDNQLRLMNAFYRFVPGEFIKFLEIDDITNIKLGDAVLKNMTVLFSDIRNFTGMSEKMTPKENFDFLNSFLKRMEPSIERNDGFVDKFVGDAIMALFSNNPQDALSAAIEMRRELISYNNHRVTRGFVPIKIGTGINSGEVMLGTVGSSNRLDTTVIGNTVNLAARLEGLTKIFMIPIIVSDTVVHGMEDPSKFALREIDLVTVKGKTEPVIIYEAFDADPPEVMELKLKTVEKLKIALDLYQAGDLAGALSEFEKCLEIHPADPIAKIHVKRCRQYIAAPPEGKWSGVSDMHSA